MKIDIAREKGINVIRLQCTTQKDVEAVQHLKAGGIYRIGATTPAGPTPKDVLVVLYEKIDDKK